VDNDAVHDEPPPTEPPLTGPPATGPVTTEPAPTRAAPTGTPATEPARTTPAPAGPVPTEPAPIGLPASGPVGTGTAPAGPVPEIRALATSVVYADDWIRLRRDDIERQDGSQGTYAFIEKRDFALVVPAENAGFHLVEEYRYPLGRRAWSFPQGGFPSHETGTFEELARMELAQETGLRAARMVHLGAFAAGHGSTNQFCQAFLATGLTPGPSDLEPEEFGLEHAWVPRERFEEMIRTGAIVDDSTLAVYALLLLAERRGELVLP
jgi:8-oxo-dGTP pyrophosphatase MutT (NUDIX family)